MIIKATHKNGSISYLKSVEPLFDGRVRSNWTSLKSEALHFSDNTYCYTFRRLREINEKDGWDYRVEE